MKCNFSKFCSSETHTHTFTHQWCNHQERSGVQFLQFLGQGHFDMQTRGAKLLIGRRPARTPELQLSLDASRLFLFCQFYSFQCLVTSPLYLCSYNTLVRYTRITVKNVIIIIKIRTVIHGLFGTLFGSFWNLHTYSGSITTDFPQQWTHQKFIPMLKYTKQTLHAYLFLNFHLHFSIKKKKQTHPRSFQLLVSNILQIATTTITIFITSSGD